jgi:predicted patatin/cPLA2 family phospholipase
VKTADDPFVAIKASCAITEMYPKPVIVNNSPYTDGGTSMVCPVRDIVRWCKLTDLLVIAPYPCDDASRDRVHLSGLAGLLFPVRVPPPLQQSGRMRAHEWNAACTWLEHHQDSLHYSVFSTPKGVGQQARVPHTIKNVIDLGESDAISSFLQ